MKLTADSKNAIKTYIQETKRDIKLLEKGLLNDNIEMIRNGCHGIEMNGNWIVELIEKYKNG